MTRLARLPVVEITSTSMHRLDAILDRGVRRCTCGLLGSSDELHTHFDACRPPLLDDLLAECEAGWREVDRAWWQWAEQIDRREFGREAVPA